LGKLFSTLFAQFKEFYRSLGPAKKLSITAVFVIILVTFSILTMMVSGKDYVTLLTNIPNEQLTSIIEKLNQKNIPFQLRDDAKTVAVPKELLHTTQMNLMSEIGSPRMGNIGLELFDKQDFGTNSYAQKINYQRALQGELMRSINTLSSVKQSKVILALPVKKTFMEEGGKATASVVIELYPGKNLSSDQIRGIRYLVSSAVEGLDPDKVSVVDDRGKMLTKSSDAATSATSEILELKSSIEKDFEERIESILSKAVGQAKVIARVEATLNGRTIQSVEESYDPEKTAIKSQQSEEESMDGARTNPAGVPGSRSNLPGSEDAGQVGFKQDVKKEIKTTNYEVPKTIKNIKEGAGNIERLSVAVLVDGTTSSKTKEDGSVDIKWNERTPEELKKYETLVKSAIGFSQQRGDSVKIENIQFIAEDFSEADRLLTSLERRKLIHALFKWALLGFGLALFFFVVVRPFMQWITDSFQDSVEDMLPRTIEELEELQTVDNSLPGMTTALPVLAESVDPDKAESELLKDRIMTLMSNNEEKAANAFGLWLVRKDG
jgi:flagellar M-ring protein FliF